MTPKEKANELLEKMTDNYYTDTALVEINRRQAKRCAIIAVDEILNTLSPHIADYNARYYWRAVKAEIELL
jgi:hypothetical protein